MSIDLGSGNRRDFMKKAAYVVPAVLSMNIAIVEARAGSGEPELLQRRKGKAPERGARDGGRTERRTDREK